MACAVGFYENKPFTSQHDPVLAAILDLGSSGRKGWEFESPIAVEIKLGSIKCPSRRIL
jgi:hypothetical protein